MADDPSSSGSPAARTFLAFAPMLRAVGIASDAKKLILAAAGLALLCGGWWGIARAFGDHAPLPILPGSPLAIGAGTPEGWSYALARRVAEPARAVVAPFADLLSPRPAGAAVGLQSALMGLWALIVWGIFGGAIARIAVVQAACGRRIGIGSAVRFAFRKAGSLIGAPLIPFLAVILFIAANAALGLVSRIPGGVGPTVVAVLGFIPIALGMVTALILLGLALGWPLMHVTIAAEDEDAPDALSRSYSYVNQRFFRYAIHVALAWGIGMVGLFLAAQFARFVLHLAGWSVALGASANPDVPPSARSIADGWAYLVALLLHGWAYSYFWSAASILYLILRRDVDGKEWDDVALPEHEGDRFAAEPASTPEPAPAVEATA
ncbi:hypothetical protein TA3x_001267 [Tundrisphaera sp. TA3]|uniref:hypothetical protein n=1 Tax=Tundrisphaera sp. TA3 TaxID=3435775 RepID=UPI003EBFD99C